MRDTLETRLKDAMRAKDEFSVLVLRGLLNAIHNREIEFKGQGREIDEESILEVIAKEQKKRAEAARLYKDGGRNDLAHKEEKEAEFINQFLPAQLSDEELAKEVKSAMASFKNPTIKDMGAIMKEVMSKVKGRADGSRVSQRIKELLS